MGCCHSCNTSLSYFLSCVSHSIYVCWLVKSLRVLNSTRCRALIFWGSAMLHVHRSNATEPVAASSPTFMSAKDRSTGTKKEAASCSQLHLLMRPRASIKPDNLGSEGGQWMAFKLLCLHYLMIYCFLKNFYLVVTKTIWNHLWKS